MNKIIAMLALVLTFGTMSGFAQQDAHLDKMLRTQSLLETLELSDEQEAEFVRIRDSYQDRMYAIRKRSNGDTQKMMADLKAIQYEQVEEVRDVMTEEQQAAFDELLEQRGSSKNQTPARVGASPKKDTRVLE